MLLCPAATAQLPKLRLVPLRTARTSAAVPRRRKAGSIVWAQAQNGAISVPAQIEEHSRTSPDPVTKLTPYENSKRLFSMRPAYKLWVERWWSASSISAVVSLLQLPEANVDIVDDRGETKLLQAARLAQTDVVKVRYRGVLSTLRALASCALQ